MPKPFLAITVKTNADQVARTLRTIGRRQLPFAAAAALSRTANRARDAVRKNMDRSFTVRSSRVRTGVRSHPASKRDWPHSTAYVGVLDDWLAIHATGGIKKPERGRYLAIRTKAVRLTKSGRVRASQRPRRITARPGGRIHGSSGEGRITLTNRRAQGAAKKGGITFFNLRRRAKIRKSWPFVREVRAVVVRTFPREFHRSFLKALKTAR